MSRFSYFAAFLALLALAGCAASPDAEEMRLCRLAAATLAPEGARLDVLGQTELGRARAPSGRTLGLVRVDVMVQPGAGPQWRDFAVCRFERSGEAPPELAAVSTRIGPMSDVKLFFLRRFWLDTPEGRISDPDPFGGAYAPTVPRAVAMTAQHAANALTPMAIYALLAGAYALVYALVARINLAFGEFAALAGYAAFFALAFLPMPAAALVAAAALGLWTAVIFGVATSRLVFLPLRRAPGFQTLVATMGLSIALQELLRLTQGSAPRNAPPVLSWPIPLLRAGDFVATATPVALLSAGLAVAACAGTLALIARSRFGRDWRAFAQDPLAARLFGVSPARVFVLCFALASALAGLAGVLMSAWHGSVGANAATGLGLKALTGAILGGLGSVGGAMLGGALIGLFETAWSAFFPLVWREAAIYALLALVLALRPGGFFGDGEESSGRRREARDRET